MLVGDDQPLFQDALARAVRQDAALELVGQVDDPGELVAAVAHRRPDVVIVDADMLDDATTATASTARLLVLAANVDSAAAFEAIEAGTAGYLSKDAEGEQICRAIAAVARGETVMDAAVQTGIAHEMRLRVRDPRPTLSPREREILALIADGRTTPEIAAKLHLGTTTIKTHLFHLYEKLGVTERAAAVAVAMRQGLVE